MIPHRNFPGANLLTVIHDILDHQYRCIMPEQKTVMDYVTTFFSQVPLVLYTIIAIMLTIIALVSLYDATILIWHLVIPSGYPVEIVSVINALLLTITIIVLFETVTVYFRTKHVEVRALLVAGLTGMVRHILVYNMESVDPLMLTASVVLLAVLIAGIVLVRPEPVT